MFADYSQRLNIEASLQMESARFCLAGAAEVFHSAAVAWLESLDVSLFRTINKGLSNDLFES